MLINLNLQFNALLCSFPIPVLVSFLVPVVTLNLCFYHDIWTIILWYSFTYVLNKSSVSPYDEFFIILYISSGSNFQITVSHRCSVKTLLVFICAGECHVEKWKTKVHIGSAHWKRNNINAQYYIWSISSFYAVTHRINDYFYFHLQLQFLSLFLFLMRILKYVGATNYLAIKKTFWYLLFAKKWKKKSGRKSDHQSTNCCIALLTRLKFYDRSLH